LREIEQGIRRKMDGTLAPEDDMGHPELADIIDMRAIQSLMDDFHALTLFPASIVDLKGNVLVAMGWQDICTRFHRAHPTTRGHCMESDLHLSRGIPVGEFRLYKCKNNMWDIATPIMVGGRHLGNLFSGQFFFEGERMDYDLFRSQAAQHGFDEVDYIAALERVPLLNRGTMERGMAFLVKLCQMISLLGYTNIKLARSLTERTALADSLKRSEECYRLAMEGVNNGLWDWDLKTDKVYYSSGWKAMLGYTEDELENRLDTWKRLVHPQDLEPTLALMRDLVEAGSEKCEAEIRMRHKDGHYLDVLSRAFLHSEGETKRMVGTHVDITARKRAEDERALVEAQLRQAQKMESLGTLASGIAHDFNNILGIIVGYAEMAEWDTDEASPVRANLKQVQKAAHRAKDLVRQILAFSRQSEQQKKPIQVGLIVKEAMKMLRASLPSTIEVKVDIASKSVVLADPTQIHQVLMNLCTNASHAMQERGGILEVSLTDVHLHSGSINPQSGLNPGRYVRLGVRDTGHGIDSITKERIFDPFFTTKGQGVGTGLGLAVVHGIAQSHGGATEVESVLDRGTIFHVFLPAVDNARTVECKEASPLPRGRERILVVDDEPELAKALKSMLEHLGYRVASRTNGIEALEAFRHQSGEERFDLVVTDLTMPHLTGMELAREVLELQPTLPVLLCTGFSEGMDSEKARNLGIRGYFLKPFILKELAGIVRAALDARPECEDGN
jgi:PAS domain S-box-containing protein